MAVDADGGGGGCFGWKIGSHSLGHLNKFVCNSFRIVFTVENAQKGYYWQIDSRPILYIGNYLGK